MIAAKNPTKWLTDAESGDFVTKPDDWKPNSKDHISRRE